MFTFKEILSMLYKLCPPEESDLFIIWTKQSCENLKFSHFLNNLFAFEFCILNPVKNLMCQIINLIQSNLFFSVHFKFIVFWYLNKLKWPIKILSLQLDR